jgi:hypothetical protein
MGLFPTMLKAMRESREKALTQRMYQTITEDLHENPVGSGTNRTYSFDAEGFLLAIDPPRSGQRLRTGSARFTGFATNNTDTIVPGAPGPNPNLVISRVRLDDTVRSSTLLERPVWTTTHE